MQRIHDMLGHTTYPKFVVVTVNPPIDSSVECIKLPALEIEPALRLVKSLLPKVKVQEITRMGV